MICDKALNFSEPLLLYKMGMIITVTWQGGVLTMSKGPEAEPVSDASLGMLAGILG